MRKKVTIQQIASKAGVSKFSVSRTLSGKAGVSERTRELILHAAEQLGYYNQTSSAPADNNSGKNKSDDSPREARPKGTILVLFPNVRFQNYDSAYWGPILDGVTTRLNEYSLDILTVTEPTYDNLFSLLNPDAIIGAITIGAVSTMSLYDLHRLEIPVIMVDHLDSTISCDTIFTDNQSSMRELMNLLISKGFKKFQFVGNKSEAYSFFERWTVYKMTLEQFGLSIDQNDELLKASLEDMEQALTVLRANLPEVFICVNDATAMDLIEALKRQGILIPDQCLVTGFDHINDQFPITVTVHVNKEILGTRAVDQMLWRFANPNAPMEKKQIAAEVMVREQISLPKSEPDAIVENRVKPE
ncbi:LacI family DNA-binding transcriptional regulator [Neobacillus mesonae]|nr:LacI family DNA-binding transcriptional regulator [Neobacillus mesonae]